MGFSVVFAAIITCLVILFAVGVITLNLANYWIFIEEINEKSFKSLMEKKQTNVDIINVEPVTVNNTASIIYLETLNRGETSISAIDFQKMDLILEYISNATNEKKILWLPYNQSGESDNWIIEDVYTEFNTAEIINPINVSKPSGQWDPHEILKIKIQLSEINLVRAQSGDYILILISTPNAVKSTYLYTF